MVKKYALTFLFCLLCGFVFSQHAVLKGFTYDESSGESLPYCTIQLMGTSYGALSDASGGYGSLGHLRGAGYRAPLAGAAFPACCV